MSLNRGQFVQLNVGAAVAFRASFFVEAILRLTYDESSDSGELSVVRAKLADYRALVDELRDRFGLTGDPHDVRPIAIDQALRMRDALNVQLVDELPNFGALDPSDERVLRQRLATLSLLVDEIVRAIARLPSRTC